MIDQSSLTTVGASLISSFMPSNLLMTLISVCATNIVGRDTSSAELYMEGLGKIDDTSYIDPETLRRMQKR